MDAVSTALNEADAMEERLLEFAARAGAVVDALPDTRLGKHVAGQLVRCGTSPAPNYGEACAAESRADFVHKLAIVLRELRETRVWLKLCIKAKCLPASKLSAMIVEATELMKIVGKSIVTAKANESKRRIR